MTRQRAGALATFVALLAVLLTPAAVLAVAPVAGDDAYSVDEDQTLVVSAALGVLGNDSDPESDPMTAVKDTDPADGTLSLAADGSFTYDPAQDFNGTDTFTYHVEAGGESSGQATVTITISAVNDPPSGTLDTATMTVGEDSGAASDPGRVTAISKGPADEAVQTITFTATPANAALFSSGPAISSIGTLTFTPAANANGSTSVSVSISDGITTVALSGTFTITITAVEDAPSGVLDTVTMTVAEDSGAASDPGRVGTITNGGADEAGQTISFTVTPANAALFATQPAISAAGTLTFTPAANVNGSTSVTVSISDGGAPIALGSFTISITAVNDPPSGILNTVTMTVVEDSGAATNLARVTSISKGPADEAGQTITFTATPGNAALFSVQPAISSIGTLTFTPAGNAAGTTSVSVSIADGGAPVALGSFLITITAVNDPPTGVLDTVTMTVAEDSGAASDPGRVGSITNGGADEAGQTITFTVTPVSPALFSVQPAISSIRTLTFTPAANAAGTTSVSVSISDGIAPAVALGSFTISISAVNDPPTFVLGPPPTVTEDSGSASYPNFLTAISPGPTNESGQVAAVVLPLTVANTALFASIADRPTIGPTGTLTFRPATNRVGSSLVTVNVSDNGGTANGGDDTGTQTFTITVGPANDPPIASDDPEPPAESYPVQAGVLTPLDVLANDTTLPDVGETLTIISATKPGHGTVTIAVGGTGLSYRSTIGFAGNDTFRYTISDGFSTATADVYVTVADTLPPVLGTPTFRFVTGAQLTSTVKVRHGWSATDVGSGIKSYDVQKSTNGGTTWTTIYGATTATHATRSLAFWKTYTFRFRARDKRNRLSAWSTWTTFTPARYQETIPVATYSAGWRTGSIASASGNHTKYARSLGELATFAFTGRAVSLVSPRGPTRGKAEIRVDGVLVATINLYRSRTDARRHVWSRSWSAIGPHVVSVRVLGTSGHPRFDIDAWTILR